MLLASSGAGAGVGVWVGLWIATIVLGLVLYSMAPERPGMDAKAVKARRAILVTGFLPCFGINGISSLMAFSQYKVRTRGLMDHGGAVRRPQNTRTIQPGSAKQRNQPPAGGNPFASGGGPAGDPPPAQSGPSPDNPFA